MRLMCVKSKQLEQQAVSKGCVCLSGVCVSVWLWVCWCVCVWEGVHCRNCLHKATLSEKYKQTAIEMLLVLIILYLLALSLHFLTLISNVTSIKLKVRQDWTGHKTNPNPMKAIAGCSSIKFVLLTFRWLVESLCCALQLLSHPQPDTHTYTFICTHTCVCIYSFFCNYFARISVRLAFISLELAGKSQTSASISLWSKLIHSSNNNSNKNNNSNNNYVLLFMQP